MKVFSTLEDQAIVELVVEYPDRFLQYLDQLESTVQLIGLWDRSRLGWRKSNVSARQRSATFTLMATAKSNPAVILSDAIAALSKTINTAVSAHSCSYASICLNQPVRSCREWGSHWSFTNSHRGAWSKKRTRWGFKGPPWYAIGGANLETRGRSMESSGMFSHIPPLLLKLTSNQRQRKERWP